MMCMKGIATRHHEKEEDKMSHYLKKNWGLVFVPCFFGVLAQAAYTVIQLLMMQSFQAAFDLNLNAFIMWTLACIGGYIAYLGLSAISGALEARAKRTLNNQVRHDLYLSLLKKSHTEYHGQDNGEYLSWLSTNIKQINGLAWVPFFSMVNQIAMIVCCVVALFSLHWVMLAFGLASAAVMLVLPKAFTKKMEKLGQVCADAEASGISKMKDLLAGIDVLRSFGRADRFIKNGDAASDEMESASCKMEASQNLVSCGIGAVSVCLQFLQQIVTVFLAVQGKILVGAISSASNLTAGITSGLSAVASNRMSMASAKPYFKNITAHADEESFKRKTSMDALSDAITINNLSFGYGEKRVLDSASFRFKKGGKYALTGPSGCGKSTILKILLGWLPNYQGTICFDTKNAHDLSQEELLQQMSYIEQDVFLFNSTIRDNITLGFDFTDEMIERAIKGSALDGDLANMPLGLDTPVGEDGSNLSGGQKQRVAIARALIHNRSILLVDEGTSALDQKNADIVEQSLLSNPDLTLILVSHHLTKERKAQFTKVYELEPVVNTALDMAT